MKLLVIYSVKHVKKKKKEIVLVLTQPPVAILSYEFIQWIILRY